jgi:enoyl-CoA hydratase/carnithine racemase
MNPGGRTIEVPADYRQLKYETIYVNWVNTATGQATSDGLVVQLTLNRPPVNSFTQRQAYEIAAAFELFNVDRRVKCIIITAHGDKFFGSGADLSDPSALEDGDGEGQYRDG